VRAVNHGFYIGRMSENRLIFIIQDSTVQIFDDRREKDSAACVVLMPYAPREPIVLVFA